ncbi:MAG: hypothetical protein P9M06_05100 [Candidatus Saelkia tenebricola]|nr:hypothetical protein [Candidatus Saelkia tenebricola]
MKIIKNIGLFVVLVLFFVSNFADARRAKSNSILLAVNHYRAILNQDPRNELLLGNLIEQLRSVDAEEALTASLVLMVSPERINCSYVFKVKV